MKNGTGQLREIYLDSGIRIDCPPEMIPTPGQYILAHKNGSDSPLAVPVFFSNSALNGFRSAPIPNLAWTPGARLNIRGPLGRGFSIPASARKVALIAFDDSPARLRGLIPIAFKQGAEVVVVCNSSDIDLPEAVEVQPLKALADICRWADYAAFDMGRETMNQLKDLTGELNQLSAGREAEAQILVRAPMPCGGIAECGVCALTVKHEWKMLCKDGPVFDL